VGASYIVTSANASLDSKKLLSTERVGISGTVDCLLQYVSHRLFPASISYPDMRIQDSFASVFIPAGLDSPELIELSCPHIHTQNNSDTNGDLKESLLSLLQAQFGGGESILSLSDLLDYSASDRLTVNSNSSSESNELVVDIEDEQQWLTGLHNKYSALSSPSKAAASSTTAVSATATRRSSAIITPAVTDVSSSSALNNATTGAAAATAKPVVRRSTRANANTGSSSAGTTANSQDPTDFFKNLLISTPATTSVAKK
jgi:hypothetical protein